MIRGRTKAIAVGALALLLAACGSTADTGAGATGAGGVKTDKGVTDTTISLGIMGDTSGVFKNLGAAINSGPMSYRIGNKQYVSIVSGLSLSVFALDE